MATKVILFSSKTGEINSFLNKFYTSTQNNNTDMLSWKKHFPNPVDVSEIIASFSDNHTNFDIDMWISFDKDVFIKVSPLNADFIIKYIFERFPY